MARLACTLLGIDPSVERKSIFVYMEIGRCAADAVMVVTGASPTNSLMLLVGYGKVAATFVSLKSHKAFRISERHDSREMVIQMRPELPTWEAQRDTYQLMPDYQLFRWQPVLLRDSLPDIPDKHCVTCQNCGDRIHEYSEVNLDEKTLCKACAFGAYFTSSGKNSFSDFL